MKNASEIKINSIMKQTEKAICVNVDVCWNAERKHQKDIWFPKSTCEVVTVNGETHIIVADWMIEKTIIANMFHGYYMYFYWCSNTKFSAFN